MLITITHPVTKAAVQIDDLVALAKGMIGPNDLANGGTLKPQASAKLISMVFKNDFLMKIQTVMMDRLTRDVDAVDIQRRQLVRVAEGEEPDEAEMPGASNNGCVLSALPVQLFPTLKKSFLRANKDNPNLISEVESGFATRFGNDFVDLGFNGIKDDNSAGFLTLNKGWVQISKDSAATKKKVIDPALNGWRATLSAIKDEADHYYRRDSVFVMNDEDADKYWREIGLHVTGQPLASDDPRRQFEGKSIEANPDCPTGIVLFTPLKNLVFGQHTDIDQTRKYHERKRVLEYTFDTAVDYEIAVKEALVIGRPA